ncbi:helix-turn-helix domain-containing protein [Algibacter pectinivorans]|uniref:Transcriptional regulator, AlpA family n=1 Tax=Algibacter pectinivorans TaxID=870482 RepID=A0A1I1NQF1_9FLAO|nr:helix-turn-helix domain-containing protein [Algibacter pectinivorans]SFC97728.1 transcriptional regulator, AlpA family [Algibacter pectinivorans]
MNTLSFDQLPNVVAELQRGQSEILALLSKKAKPQPEIETPINLNEVSEITGLTKPTLYGYVQRNEIPHNKKGNRLYFFKSEIVDWIKTGKQKTLKELKAENDEFLSNTNK